MWMRIQSHKRRAQAKVRVRMELRMEMGARLRMCFREDWVFDEG